MKLTYYLYVFNDNNIRQIKYKNVEGNVFYVIKEIVRFGLCLFS